MSEAAVAAIFAAYGAAFDDADADAVTALFAYPATIWQFGEAHVFEDADDLAENVEALIDVFDDAGIVLTTPDIRAMRIAGGAAFATVAWRQEDASGESLHEFTAVSVSRTLGPSTEDASGESLHEFTCHYLLIAGADGWRIATVVNEAENQEG